MLSEQRWDEHSPPDGCRGEYGTARISEPSPAPRRTHLLWMRLGICEQHSPSRAQHRAKCPLLIKYSKIPLEHGVPGDGVSHGDSTGAGMGKPGMMSWVTLC